MSPRPQGIPYDHFKRAFDLVGASLVLVVSLPIQAIVAIAIARRLGTPVLFRQQRPGLNGKIFTLIKFRTMRDVVPADDLVTDEQRLTPFGKRLRSFSLDELPTLVNVIKGDMSMVGPRPLLVSYLNLYTTEQSRRHEVRPGVTGLAQVNGRNAISWEKKFAFDIEYVNTRSLRVDVQILAHTLVAVLRRDGISSEGHITAPIFVGSQDGSERA